MSVTQEEVNEIAKAVKTQLDQSRHIDIETHRKHHDYIDTLIIEVEKREARREQWIRVVGGWGIIITITAISAAIWEYIKDHVK